MSLSQATPNRIIDSRHPSFLSSLSDWTQWRMTYRGGIEFVTRYLKQFSSREDAADFKLRRDITPIPSFAKAAINDVRNSVFQRMRDITRVGGSQAYREAVSGMGSGIDRRGSTMNAFLGMSTLTDLLVMGRVGVYVDNSVLQGDTLADAGRANPYCYAYQIEDILSWTCLSPDKPSEYRSLLLRDTCLDYDRRTLLPMQTFERFRLVWIDDETGLVNLQFYALDGTEIDRDGNPQEPGNPTVLQLNRIPFVMLDIIDSLIKDVAQHQIALLNLTSSDVWYSLRANFPFYVEQRDLRAGGGHLKQSANPDGSATAGGQGAHDTEITVGAMQGRAYDIKANAPSFIHPSSEPLKASLLLQEKLETDIRKLINLAVVTLGQQQSAQSKQMDNQGLEAGLSFIGLVLESAERKIAEYWAAYEDKNPERREVAHIKYPDRYSLKTDTDRITEATLLSKLMFTVPGRQVKREISKAIVGTLLGGRVEVGTIDEINQEIDTSDYLTSDPNTIIQGVEAGLIPEQIGSMALGFPEDAYLQARKDHALRIERIQQAQAANSPGPTVIPGERGAMRSVKSDTQLMNAQTMSDTQASKSPASDPGARGVADMSADPANSATAEKKASRDRTMKQSKKKRTRGQGRFIDRGPGKEPDQRGTAVL